MNAIAEREAIALAIQRFRDHDLFENAINLFKKLGYNTDRQNRLSDNSYDGFRNEYDINHDDCFNEEKALSKEWRRIEVLFQLSKSEIDSKEEGVTTEEIDDRVIESYLFFAIELKHSAYSRTQFSEISKQINGLFRMPVILLFKHDQHLTLSITHRRKNRKDADKDVLEKVVLLKDIDVVSPHPAHLRIIEEMRRNSIEERNKSKLSSFVELDQSWQSIFSINLLNKLFYKEIAAWFDRAISEIQIPNQKPRSPKHKDFAIRLIARLVFVWFLKELRVVKEDLLIPTLLHGNPNRLIRPKKAGSSYYKFVLQNLFFNVLNAELGERRLGDFDVYANNFDDFEKINSLLNSCPFLNGGLFDEHENDFCTRGKASDNFEVPDHLLLGEEGLNSILSKFKFTTSENTPIEEEIAVDPEMLGRIFENLLAEQSEDTQEAARKSAGAFYTPRPIVSYMCRNVLSKHLGIEIKPENGKAIVRKLLETKVIDPACGSGAFLVGMLEEMMRVLEIVDPDGNIWFAEMLKSKEPHFLEYVSGFIADKQVKYVKKLGLLRNCLFGVDILEYAIEITKLRCWLSLIVEQKVDFSKSNYNLKPLPNLDFKFFRRDSLLRTFRGKNINGLIRAFGGNDLLKELCVLERSYFISNSEKGKIRESIEKRIGSILESIIDQNIVVAKKALKAAQDEIDFRDKSTRQTKEIRAAEKKKARYESELSEWFTFKEKARDYLIESIVFPEAFNENAGQAGFDILIGNPPYVNTKLISRMKLTKTLKDEYGYCDDLYNHFTIRGLELLRHGGYLAFITSNTFLTLQTKENMRRLFLEVPLTDRHGAQQQGDFLNDSAILDSRWGCHLWEIVNTPKAFAALVDTAIFTVQKISSQANTQIDYIDIRFPDEKTFGISKEEWRLIKQSKENVTGWERVLTKVFFELSSCSLANWEISHSCDTVGVLVDSQSAIEKYRTQTKLYHESINYAIFAPNKNNCKLFTKIIKPSRPIFDCWWEKIESSKKIEKNKKAIKKYLESLTSGHTTLMGLITEGGQGLATGDNGRFVGIAEGSKLANKIVETRPAKLKAAVDSNSAIRRAFPELAACRDLIDYSCFLNGLSEKEVRNLFDKIKSKFGSRVFGKGYLYRIVLSDEIFDVGKLTESEKEAGIKSVKETFVPYDKGDKDGNRWYAETPYYINWNRDAVQFLKSSPSARYQNSQFYFRNGFCWSDVLNPSNRFIKCRLKQKTVNDVLSMSLYDISSIGDDFLIALLNSNICFTLVREFLNTTVHLQMNDIRKVPVRIPNQAQLKKTKDCFHRIIEFKRKQFRGDLLKKDADQMIRPLEKEIDAIVEELYGVKLV